MTRWQEFFRQEGYPYCEKIGEGGFGEVYRIKGKDGMELAAKLTGKGPEQAKFLIREAEISKILDHPSFPKFYGLHERKEVVYLLMEYIEGENLENVIMTQRSLHLKQILTIGKTMAEILSYMHLKGYVYRDLKPGNLILQKDGALRMVDFGCVLTIDQEKSKVGSVPYAAPEQLTDGVCRPECDLYSWGMVMKHLVSKCMDPKEKGARANGITLRRAHCEELEQLKKWIKLCTETDPGKRFVCAEQLAYLLKEKHVKPRFVICQNIWKNTCRFEEK